MLLKPFVKLLVEEAVEPCGLISPCTVENVHLDLLPTWEGAIKLRFNGQSSITMQYFRVMCLEKLV